MQHPVVNYGAMRKKNKQPKKAKKRKFNHLTLTERTKIEVRYRDGWSFRAIARYLGDGRTGSAVMREIGGRPRRGVGKYQAHIAQEKALGKRTGKRAERLKNDLVRKYVIENLKLGWSPKQISIRLPIEHRGESISHEAIYTYIYAHAPKSGYGRQKQGLEDLRKYLPRRHKRRQKKGFRQARKMERPILPSIEDRPASVNKRKTIGDWEDDCMVSRQSKGRLKSINERRSGVLLLGKMEDGSIQESNRVVVERLGVIPEAYRRTLTRDRGSENLGYREIETTLNLSVYFAHAYCSQERGSNENLNGLVRRFFPKGTDLSKLTDAEVMHVEMLINTRPRKRHGGKLRSRCYMNQQMLQLIVECSKIILYYF